MDNTTIITTDKVYLCDKETFLKLKAEQKSYASRLKNKDVEYQKALAIYDAWYAQRPRPAIPDHITPKELENLSTWRNLRPLYPLNIYFSLKKQARAHNIAYGLLRGRNYLQIEAKTRLHNEYNGMRRLQSAVADIFSNYGIEAKDFNQLVEDIK